MNNPESPFKVTVLPAIQATLPMQLPEAPVLNGRSALRAFRQHAKPRLPVPLHWKAGSRYRERAEVN